MKKFFILLILTFTIVLIPTIFIDFDTSNLIKPALFPPKLLFPIVWSILYLLMSISVYLSTKNDNEIYIIYFIQLIVNSIWSPLFFGLKWYFLSFLWLLLLLILATIMVKKMKEKNMVAYYLQIPYIIWIIFAGYLNLFVYILN
ncbi:MAG: tryptophan-rich sensory protein [Firmicutes bacterium]|nr:tryptophan-rich sensory protein [Bacillota bacterium]